MQLISYQAETGPRVAGVRQGECVDLNRADPAVPACIKRLLTQGADGLGRARAALESGQAVAAETVRLLPPIPRPEKIICVGLNYADHAKEGGTEPPAEPVIFNKFPTTLRAHGETIVLPAASRQVDFEAELVVVIGTAGHHIPEERAREHVAGYCCGNDVSARDWQKFKSGGQWLLGKSFDTFGPLGPALVTADEIERPDNLHIQLRLNGETMQDSNTSQLIFPIEKLIAYVSGVCTLVPGDLIFTGTPSGVGFARKPPVFLLPGDTIEVEIEKIGTLCNTTVAG